MKVVVTDLTLVEHGKDIPMEADLSATPLFIGARKQQVTRVGKNKHITSIAYWELEMFGYLDQKGELRPNVFKKHDVIYMADPSRVHVKFRKAYEKLIRTLDAI